MDRLAQEDGVGDKDELKIDDAYRQSFQSLKEELLSSPILAYPDFRSSEMFILDTDWSASNCAIGAVLSQKQDGKERVIAYAAKRLNSTQRNYAPTKGELLAAVTFMRHFHYYLRHRKFVLRTDHAALKYIRTMDPPKGTIARWLDCIANFDFDVIYREGKKHGNADALSRLENLDPQNETEDHNELISHLELTPTTSLRHAQKQDPDLCLLLQCLQQQRVPDDLETKRLTEEGLRYVTLMDSFLLQNDILMYRETPKATIVPVIPAQLVPPTIKRAHLLLSHKGMNTTLEFLKKKVFFLNMKSKIERYLATCNECQVKTKPSTRGQHKVLHSHRPGEPWSVLAVDFVGPFPTSPTGFKYLLTIKDTFTRWLEAFPTRDMTASTVIKILAEQVFSRYGLCARIHSDNGRQFVSDLYHKMMSKFGIQVSQTPPYNPQSNPVERAHRDLETSLTALCKNKTSKWPDYLPQALFAQRIAICRSTGFSPFELMFGRNPRCELDVMYPLPTDLHQSPRDSAEEYFYKQQEAFQAARLREDVTIRRQRMAYKGPVKRFQEGQSVWLFVPRPPKNFVKLSIWWTGPWVVTNVLNALTYKLEWHNDPKRTEIVTVDRLRPYFHDIVIKPPNTLYNPIN